jgi:enoyl-CoA hydratase/carnithine racemase/NAD(P)-dependent dehydrogenase (short-subunit alcohol dehydrogenase family)/acyl carrier protein
MSPARITSKLTISDTSPLVSEHRVQDIHILPGVSMLDATYKVLAAARIDTDAVVLRDILFHEPVVTNAEADRRLTVTVEHSGDRGTVAVTSVPWKDGRALSDLVTSHMTCSFHREAAFDVPPLPADLDARLGRPEDLDACYSVTRRVGIFHDSFMKCLGTVAPLPSGGFVGTVSLGDRAAAHAGTVVLHPVLLDCSTIVPLFHLRHLVDVDLFIPFVIEELRARPLTGLRTVRVAVDPPDFDVAGKELLHHSFGIYDLAGQPLVRFRRFGVKRVRSLDGIRRLLARSSPPRASPPPPPAPVPAAAPVSAPAPVPAGGPEPGRDPFLALVGSLIARHRDGAWSEQEDADKPFFDIGLDSLALLDLSDALGKALQVQLYPTLLFERPNAAALAAYLRETVPEPVVLAALGGAAPAAAAPPQAVPAALPASAASRERAAEAPQILVPRWLPVRMAPAASGRAVALVSSGDDAGLAAFLRARMEDRACFTGPVETFQAEVQRGLAFDELWLLGAGHEAAFAVVKALLHAGRLDAPLSVRAVTFNAFQVHREAPDPLATHGTWGLLQSLSREYPQVRVSLVDVDRQEVARAARGEAPERLSPLLVPGARARELRALRQGRTYERRLLGVRRPPSRPGPLRQGGVYAVIGGAGGVGMELVRHLRRRYQARVAVIGRRPLDAALKAQLSAEGEYERELVYVQAAVDDEAALNQALRQIGARLGKINGLVHSAMVLEDRRLSEMDAASLARVARPKVEGVVALDRATAGMELDFLLFFSSAQSFVGNASQANYAAASTFLDGYAAALRATRPYPVVVINWGFWSEVGAVATSVYRSLLARQGVHGLRAEEALAALEEVLEAGWEQAAIVAAEEQVLEEMGLSRALVLARSAAPRSVAPAPAPAVTAAPEHVASYRPVFSEAARAMEQLLPLARRRVARVLRELGLRGTDPAAVDEAVRTGRVAAEHARLTGALLRLLEAHRVTDEQGLDAQAFAGGAAALVAAHPPLRHFVPLLSASLDAYPEILAGRRPAADVLFPGGSVELVRAVYGESEISRFYNEVVARAVRALAAAQSGRPLRILEVGAGTGSTTAAVLRELELAGVEHEYWYTDLWDKLVAEAKDRLGPRHPSLRFRFLDLNVDPAAQGLREELDLVVATNVVHSTRDLHASLRHVKRLLRPGGALVLNESVQVQELSTYTFGLLPGWWNAEDPHERLADSPLASSAGWSALLSDEGFVEARPLVPADDAVPALGAQQIFLAYSDGEVRQAAPPPAPRLSVVASREELPRALAGKLRPLELPASAGDARPRHLQLFQDARDNVWLFLDNPPANTFTDELLGELCGVIQRLSDQAPGPLRKRFLYISHFGEYFSLGGDRTELVRKLAAGQHDALVSFAEKARLLLRLLASLDALVVAVVNGTAQGGGMETLLATDLQIVRDGVKVGLPEIKSGLVPGMGGLSYLAGLIGPVRTKRLVMLGELIGAREAQDLGLVSHVVDDPFAAALALPDEIPRVETALYMKQVIGRDAGKRLTADIDDWVAYMMSHAELIDARRISDSRMVLMGRAAMKAS